MMARCIELDRDGADICSLAAQFMSRGSKFAGKICALCAEICQACGDECAKHKVSIVSDALKSVISALKNAGKWQWQRSNTYPPLPAIPPAMEQSTKMTMIKPILLAALLPLGFAGCTSIPPSPDSSASHPANAQAAQGSVAPPVPMLMNITNMVEVKAVTEPATESQPGHEQHETKPKSEEPKK